MLVFLTPDPWWSVLLGFLAETGLSFVLPILMVLGGLLITWLFKKMKITDVEKKFVVEEAYDKLVEAGISYAEQQAKKLSDNPDKSGKKLKLATDFIEKMIKDWKLPEKTADWIEKKIESKLGESKVDSEKVKDLKKADE